jgi:hypothetical protein
MALAVMLLRASVRQPWRQQPCVEVPARRAAKSTPAAARSR